MGPQGGSELTREILLLPRFLTLYEQGARRSQKWTCFFILWIPKWPASVFSQQCQHTIKRKDNENNWNDHLREKFMIFSQILSTNSLSKCIKNSLENLNRDSGTQILCRLVYLNPQFPETDICRWLPITLLTTTILSKILHLSRFNIDRATGWVCKQHKSRFVYNSLSTI